MCGHAIDVLRVGRARTAGRERGEAGRDGRAFCQRYRQPVALNKRKAIRGRSGGKAANAEERNRHRELLASIRVGRDGPFERRQPSRVVDHHDGSRARLLAEDRARDARARPALRDHELPRDTGGDIFRWIAPQADGAVWIPKHLDFQ